MNIFEKISDDLRLAMLAKDKERLEALNTLKWALLGAKEIALTNKEEFNDEIALRIISKLVKRMRDSAELYKQGNRNDLSESEMAQVKIMQEYLPKKVDDTELTAIISAIIKKTGVSSITELSKVFELAAKELAGKAEEWLIEEKIKSLLMYS